jgi:hypothetical protein
MLSTKTEAKLARTEAAAAEAEAGGAQGSFTTATTNGVAQPASQTPSVMTNTTLGTTTAAGQSVTAGPFPIPVDHTAEVEYTVIGRVRIAGGTSAVDDSYMEHSYFAVNTLHSGTTRAVPQTIPAAGPVARALDATLASPGDVTVVPTVSPGSFNIVVTEVAGQGTIDWTITTTIRLN